MARHVRAGDGRRHAAGAELRRNLAAVPDVEQRKTNEMIGAELGYRYVDSPLIWDEPGGPEQLFRVYDPTAWTGVRLPHAWVAPGRSLQDLVGQGYTILRLGPKAPEAAALASALRARGAPVEVLDLPDDRLRALYGRDLFLLRPDLHIVWRGNELPQDVEELAAVATGHPVSDMARARRVMPQEPAAQGRS